MPSSSPTRRGFRLDARGPYSLAASVRFLEGFAPAAQAAADGGHVHWAFVADDYETVAGACLWERAGGAGGEIVAANPESVRGQLARVLSLDVDGRGFAAVGRRDPVVAKLQRRYPGLRPVLFFSPYEAAAWALISHRVRIRQAAAVKARMADELGETVTVHGERLRSFPPPARLLELDSFPGLAARKIANLHALAHAAGDGLLDAARLRSLPPEQALDELKKLPGVGDFSAQLILLRGAGEPDYVPANEPRLHRAVAVAYGRAEPSASELEELAQQWQPYRTWITFLLRVFLEDETGEIAGGGQDRR
jgi:DNA-3-methyladenine glycosylase II